MLRRLLAPSLAALCIAALAGCGSGVIPAVIAQSSGTPGSVTVSWTPPTENTDGSQIAGTITFDVYEVVSASSQIIVSTAATAVSGSSVQISNVPDGSHCYAVQTVELLPVGATTTSPLSATACATVQGSTAPQPSPNAPTNVTASPT